MLALRRQLLGPLLIRRGDIHEPRFRFLEPLNFLERFGGGALHVFALRFVLLMQTLFALSRFFGVGGAALAFLLDLGVERGDERIRAAEKLAARPPPLAFLLLPFEIGPTQLI